MKKLISLLMTVFMLASVISVGALADTVPAVVAVTDSTGTELTDGGTIATVEGQLTVVFESAVTDAVLDGISITATVGSFRGAVAAEIDEADSSKVNVRFGRLEDGAQYLLSVPAANFEFSFAAEVKYLTNVDFDGKQTSDIPTLLPAQNLAVLTDQSDKKLGYNTDSYSQDYSRAAIENFSQEEDGGTGYLNIHPKYNETQKIGSNKTLGLAVVADGLPGNSFNSTEIVNADKVYVLDASVACGSSSVSFGTLGDGTDRIGTAATLLLSGWKPYTKSGTWAETMGSSVVTPALTTMRLPRMVLVRENSGLSQHLYAVKTADGDYEYVGKKHNTVTNQTVKLLTVAACVSGYTYTDSKISADENSQKYRWIKCYPERLLTVIKADSYVGGEKKTLVIHMSDEFNADGVSSENIIVTRKNGEPITGFDISADSYERTITLNFPDGLRKGDYNIETKGLVGSNELIGYSEKLCFTVDVANGIEYYETANYAVTDAEGNPVEDISGKAQVSVSLDVISDEGNAFTMALVIYDGNSRVMKIVTDSAAIAEGNDRVTLSASTPDDINIGEGYTVRPLVWLDDIDAGAIFIEEFDKLTALSAQ